MEISCKNIVPIILINLVFGYAFIKLASIAICLHNMHVATYFDISQKLAM